MADTYHIRIKKDYTVAIIEDLQTMDAVEIITEDDTEIPAWQVELGMKELQNIASGNTELVPWEVAKAQLKL